MPSCRIARISIFFALSSSPPSYTGIRILLFHLVSLILYLQATAMAEYERKEKSFMENYSLTERIDHLTISYVTSHYDVKSMSVEEFLNKFKDVSTEIFELFSPDQ